MFMWVKSLPRTLNSLRRSSPAATPGSTCTARSGSSASTPRRFWMSALPSTCCDATPGSRWTESIRRHGHGLGVGARALAEGDGDINGAACRHQHVAPNQDVADDRDIEPARPGRHGGNPKYSGAVGLGGGSAVLDEDEHLREARARPGVHDVPCDNRRVPGPAPRREPPKAPQERPANADARRLSSARHDQKCNRPTIFVDSGSAESGPNAIKHKEIERYTTCSIGGCRRPEYLRQGAVSCWGAGSPAKTAGHRQNMAMPFLLPLTNTEEHGCLIGLVFSC